MGVNVQSGGDVRVAEERLGVGRFESGVQAEACKFVPELMGTDPVATLMPNISAVTGLFDINEPGKFAILVPFVPKLSLRKRRFAVIWGKEVSVPVGKFCGEGLQEWDRADAVFCFGIFDYGAVCLPR